jgi:hypothetical protein
VGPKNAKANLAFAGSAFGWTSRPDNRKESEMRKTTYLRYRRLLEIVKVGLTIVWLLLAVVALTLKILSL